MQSNPIQQRIESICEYWEESKKFNSARIVRIQCQPDEHDMIDTFYMYMIGMDTPIMDISFHFDSTCSDVNTYSIDLLKELDELISIWNNSEKEKGITHFDINWKANFNINDKKNPALLFVANFNKLADILKLNDNLYSVAILKSPTNQEQINWLKNALEAGISEKVKILIYDSVDNPLYDQFCFSNPQLTTTIALNLNMDKAMEQAAAMGDPKDPATPYRQAFMKMMNAIEATTLLLDNKAEVDTISRFGTTALHLVALSGNLGIAKVLLDRKANPNVHAKNGISVLRIAAWRGDLEVARLLLANKAEVNAGDDFNCTPLHYAAAHGNIEIVKLLLQNQANPLARSENGATPRKLALVGNFPEVVRLLAPGPEEAVTLPAP